ncbi:hypothetical protein ACLBWT_17065 [Paenibacillus sp. D51F]
MEFLRLFLPTAWGSDGIGRTADFEREQYNSAVSIIDPEVILSALQSIYGDQLQSDDYPYNEDMPIDLRTAQQFYLVHKHVVTEKQNGNTTEK